MYHLMPTQFKYKSNSAEWFMTTGSEVNILIKKGTDIGVPMNQINKNYIYHHGSSDELMDISIGQIETIYKRNKCDSAKLLVALMRGINNETYIIAKRFNNNQAFRLDIRGEE